MRARSRRLGRLSAAERAFSLADAGTFAPWDATPDDALCLGFGEVHGQPAAILAHDFATSRGATTSRDARRGAALIRAATARGAPVFLLCDSEGARVAEGPATIADNADLLGAVAAASGIVPLFAGVFGVAAGAAAYAAALCDLVVAVADRSFAFLSGPAVVGAALGEQATLDALGGTELHTATTGLFADVAADDAGVLASIRRLAAYLPPSASTAPPVRPAAAPRAACPPPMPPLHEGYDVHRVIDSLVDDGSFQPCLPRFGPSIVAGLARLSGRPVVLIASQPRASAGAIDVAASQKIARLVRLGVAFGLPVLTLADTPGFLPGAAQEQARILTHGARVISAYTEARAHVPTVAVILRRAVGGGVVLAAHAETVLALPAAQIVQMGQQAQDAIERDAGSISVSGPSTSSAAIVHRTIAPADLRPEVLRALALSRPVSPCAPGSRRAVLTPV